MGTDLLFVKKLQSIPGHPGREGIGGGGGYHIGIRREDLPRSTPDGFHSKAIWRHPSPTVFYCYKKKKLYTV